MIDKQVGKMRKMRKSTRMAAFKCGYWAGWQGLARLISEDRR
jgi:hypothetical protein